MMCEGLTVYKAYYVHMHVLSHRILDTTLENLVL